MITPAKLPTLKEKLEGAPDPARKSRKKGFAAKVVAAVKRK